MSDPAASRILELIAKLPEERRELAELWSMSEDELHGRLVSDEPVALDMLCEAADVLNVPSIYLAGQTDDYGFAVALRIGAMETTEAPEELLGVAGVLLANLKLLDVWQEPTPRPLDDMDAVRTGYHREDGRLTAARVRVVLGLGQEPIADLTGLVERLGYPVTHLELPDGLCGLTARDDHDGVIDRVILIRSGDDWARQRFTLAHELGHCVFGDPGQVIVDEIAESDRAEETRASSFARHLLLPAEALRARVQEARTAGVAAEVLIPRLMIEFGVSREVVVNALTGDGLVPAAHGALAYVAASGVGDLMARAGLASALLEARESAAVPRPSRVLSRRAREAYASGWVHARIVAEVERRGLAEVEAELLGDPDDGL